jgi:hypothetical protein
MHTPDITKIPKPLQPLDWQRFENTPDTLWSDGQELLVAVPVCQRDKEQWQYEISVIRIRCDEDYFAVTCEGDPWGWDLDDIEFYVVIRY